MNKSKQQPEPVPELERATDAAGNLAAVARRTGISRRRLGKIKAGSPATSLELNVLRRLAQGTL